MAADLSGMFAQLNKAVLGNPLVTGAGQGLLDSTSQGAGQVMANLPGQSDPYSYMTQGAKEKQGKQDLGQVNLETSLGLTQASNIYGKMGQADNQMAMAQMAQTQKAAEAKLQKEQSLRESLTKSANKYGLTDYAEQIATGAVDLEDASEAMREQETNDMLLKRGTMGRKIVAQRAGIGKEQFEELNLGAMDEDQFKNFTQGLEGKVAHYMTASGEPASIRTNKYGQVWNKDAQKWMAPSEMGLSAAPQLQKVHNVSTKMVDALGLQHVENIDDLYQKANEAVITIDNIGRNLKLVDNMPTGTLAQVELFGRKVGELLGMNYDEAANAEVFQADAAQRVAKEIKAFGAGAGLSNADREYTAQMVAGDITVTPQALKRILNIRNEVAVRTVGEFESIKARTKKALGPIEGKVMDMYELRTPEKATGGLSPNALKYFGATQ